jgi:hypothetical protein
MDLLIKHGTWVIVPIGIALSFIYLIVAPKLYPFLAARSLAEEDALEQWKQVTSPASVAPQKPVETGGVTPLGTSAQVGSHL